MNDDSRRTVPGLADGLLAADRDGRRRTVLLRDQRRPRHQQRPPLRRHQPGRLRHAPLGSCCRARSRPECGSAASFSSPSASGSSSPSSGWTASAADCRASPSHPAGVGPSWDVARGAERLEPRGRSPPNLSLTTSPASSARVETSRCAASRTRDRPRDAPPGASVAPAHRQGMEWLRSRQRLRRHHRAARRSRARHSLRGRHRLPGLVLHGRRGRALRRRSGRCWAALDSPDRRGPGLRRHRVRPAAGPRRRDRATGVEALTSRPTRA